MKRKGRLTSKTRKRRGNQKESPKIQRKRRKP
jgi:hypothetical protein